MFHGPMGQASRSRVIPAPQQAIWDVLADFGALSSWVDKIDHSCVLNAHPEVLGTTRRVQVGRTVLVERITEYREPSTLAYAIEGLPAWMGRLTNRWTLRPAGVGTEVTVTSTVDPAGFASLVTSAVTARVLAKQSDAMLDGLARTMGART
ncbi:hypothetical protein MSMEI_1249 [Mycolicibacterium smegmatis MC2 155]|uniref:Cyclase/dehydrase n=1 Tax=Mycolicibacterium smegmatis (strain ATCC 700084 / mc(2)155) TaxID=246196 RepID=I7F808_MYCS2|nr:hypothetical protein MSMEI_1249 [Mycolicibacterium smegmatis MC2 155]